MNKFDKYLKTAKEKAKTVTDKVQKKETTTKKVSERTRHTESATHSGSKQRVNHTVSSKHRQKDAAVRRTNEMNSQAHARKKNESQKRQVKSTVKNQSKIHKTGRVIKKKKLSRK